LKFLEGIREIRPFKKNHLGLFLTCNTNSYNNACKFNCHKIIMNFCICTSHFYVNFSDIDLISALMSDVSCFNFCLSAMHYISTLFEFSFFSCYNSFIIIFIFKITKQAFFGKKRTTNFRFDSKGNNLQPLSN
jgi:hypothetical protein